MGPIKRFILLTVALISFVLMPAAANAFTVLQCDNVGGAVAGTSLFDADPKNDPVNHTGECQYSGANSIVVQHVFSQVICNFVVVLNQIMDGMYCGIHYYMISIVAAVLTLYVTIYGAQILMGTAQLSTRDAITRLLKISFIYVFATQSAYGISYIFQFFMGFISTASVAVMKTLQTAVAPANDTVNGVLVCSFTGLDPNNVMSMYSFLDYLVCHALVGPAEVTSSKIQGFMFAMIIALPPMTLLFQWWLITIIQTLIRTLVAFLKSLAAIAFLVTLSPIFLAFFLFQSTVYLFENWLRYMISFSVQIVLVLAIIVFWIMTINQFVGFFDQLSNLIYPYTPVKTAGGVWSPGNGYAICPGSYSVDGNNLPTAACAQTIYMAEPPDLDGNTKVENCVPGGWRAFDANPPVCDASGNCQPPNNPSWQCDNQDLVPPEKVISQGDFLFFIFYHFFTLLLISYCFSILLEKSDEIARSLAGPSTAPSLAPGWGKGIGNVNSFSRPSFLGGKPRGESSASRLAADSSKLLGRR